MATRLRLSIIGLGGVVVLLAAGAGLAFHTLHRPLTVTPDTRVIVAEGESFTAIARRLAKRGILSDPRPITWYARATGAARQVRSGEFSLGSATTPLDLLDVLRSGTPVQHEARLLEGWTLRQTLAYLAELDTLRHSLADTPQSQLMAALGLESQTAEGWFFPDTYRFARGTQDVTVLRTAHRKMQQELDRVWQDRDEGLPYSHPYQVLIMASLIEKETGLEAERAKIARVFTSRLEQGMRLQTDPHRDLRARRGLRWEPDPRAPEPGWPLQHLSAGGAAAHSDRAAGVAFAGSCRPSRPGNLPLFCSPRRR